jgi:hypothetical protein
VAVSSLPQQLEVALRDLLAKLPDAVKNKNLEQLGADAKQHLYRIIAETLLAQDHPTVAAALLDALRDDTITSQDWSAVLKAWARDLAGSDPIAVDVVSAFDDDVLSKEEAINLVIKWVKREVTDPGVAEFLEEASTFFHTGAPEALERVLANLGLPDAVARGLSQAIATGTLTAQQVYQMVAAWVAASGEEELARLIERLPDATPEEIILAAIGERLPAEVKTILEKLLAGDWNGLFAAVLGALHLTLGASVLTHIANGKFREAAIDEIVDLLTQAGVKKAHAGPLVDAVIDLVTGARSLFASGPEADAPDLKTPTDIALWREIPGWGPRAHAATGPPPRLPGRRDPLRHAAAPAGAARRRRGAAQGVLQHPDGIPGRAFWRPDGETVPHTARRAGRRERRAPARLPRHL